MARESSESGKNGSLGRGLMADSLQSVVWWQQYGSGIGREEQRALWIKAQTGRKQTGKAVWTGCTRKKRGLVKLLSQ